MSTDSHSVVAYLPHRRLLRCDPHRVLLPEVREATAKPARADCFIGWGYKRPGKKSRTYAARYNKPYWALEDGFIRSVGLGKNGAASVGLIVDKTGVYYDASAPCDLENRINAGFTPDQEARGEAFVSQLLELRCTKYNTDVDPLPKELAHGSHVILIDQIAGDASIAGSGGGEESFAAMLEAAQNEFPHATLWIKTHPDVLTGKARGYLPRLCENNPRFKILPGNPSSYALAGAVEAVFNVSSQFGFEALMAGANVHCFAAPFYAGWGLTVDRGDPQTLARRTARPTVAMLAHAALIDYVRYRDPYKEVRIEAEDAAEILYDIKSRYLARRKTLHCVGFSGWKHPFVRQTVGTPFDPVSFYLSMRGACAAVREKGGALAIWAGKEKGRRKRQLRSLAHDLPVCRVEDGFIRSNGLGAALLPGCSLTLDETGVHFDAKRPSDMESLLGEYVLSEEERARASALFARLANESVTKYAVAGEGSPYKRPTDAKNVHLVVGQVAGDASMLAVPRGGVTSNAKLIEEVAKRYAGDVVLYRPHPDVTAGYRKGKISPDYLAKFGVTDVGDKALGTLLREVDHVHVISSLVGMEALYYGKRVHVYGGPFYAGWGLTRDRLSFPRRTRLLSPEELIFIAIAIYPYYVDQVSGYPCDVETALDRRAAGVDKEDGRKGYRWQRYIQGLRHYWKY